MARQPLPWRIGEHPPEGPLTENQIEALCEEHGVSKEILKVMSSHLSRALHPHKLHLSVINAMASIRKGEELALSIEKDLAAASKLLDRAQSNLTKLSISDKFKKRDEKDTQYFLEDRVYKASDYSRHAASNLSAAIRRGARFSVRGEVNARRRVDFRRSMVCNLAFKAWSDAGRHLGVSDQGAGKTGPLIRFVNSVVSAVTDPASELSGETIRKDLKKYLHHQKLSRMVSMPPHAAD